MKIKQCIIENYLEYILAFTIVVNTNSVWTLIGFGKINLILFYATLLILCMLTFKNILKNEKTFQRLILLLLLLLFYELVFILFNSDAIFRFIIKFVVTLFLLIFYYSCNTSNKIFNKISNIIYCISIISLFFFIFSSIMHIIPSNTSVFLEWGEGKYVLGYYGLYYETQNINLNGINLIRNTGIFTEAPMYAFQLCIALAIEVYLEVDISKKKVIIYLITLFSTFSTMGIVIAIGILLIKFIFLKSQNSIYLFSKTIVFPVILYVSISIIMFFIMDKIESSSNSFGSFSVRMDDFLAGYKAWKENIVFGHGFERHDLTKMYMNLYLRKNDVGGSSGLMMVLPQGGLWLVLLYIIPFLIGIFYGIYKNKQVIFFTTIIFILFAFTNVPYTLLMLSLIALGWSKVVTFDEN